MENNLSLVKETFKELPNNVEAEQSVIGSILVSNEYLMKLILLSQVLIFMIRCTKKYFLQ